MRSVLVLFVLIAGVESALAQGGVPLWTNRFDGPGLDYAKAIAVDDRGKIIVAGASYSPLGTDPTHSDYLTVAYSNGGQVLWSHRYHGPFYGDDVAQAVAMDKNGGVFVTGNAGTIAYSNSGVPLWTNHSAPATAITVDGSGHVFTTGSVYDFNLDWITAALSPDGVLLWTNRAGLLYDDLGKRIAVDPEGNIVVAGSWTWPTSGTDFTAVKYSPVGVPLWTNHVDARWDDLLEDMVVGKDGTVFLTGRSASSGVFASSVHDMLTIAISSHGLLLWTNRYSGREGSPDWPAAIKTDPEGNVIVTGASVGDGTGFDYTTIKYSSTGAPLWTNRYHRLGSLNNSPSALAIAGNGDVVVTGGTYLDGDEDIATVAYSSAGVPTWTNHYNRPAGAQALALDPGGNVFVAGTSGSDFITIKYSSSLEPFLRIQNVGNQAVLTWFHSGFSLQSAPLATGTFTNVSGASSPYTNLVTRSQQFFRLIGN